MLRKYVLISAFSILSLLPCSASAAIVGFAFTGKVIEVGEPIFGIDKTAAGKAVTGTFSYDSALTAPPLTPFLTYYQILSPFQFVAYIDGNRVESGAFFAVSIYNDTGGNAEDMLTIDLQPIVNGIQTNDGVFGISLASFRSNTFADGRLPESLDLENFDVWTYGTLTRSGNNFEILNFSVESITLTPLPGTLAMMLAGLGALGIAARRRLKV